jgi:TonB-dependent starch-binding outer membrane protein SusC
MTKKYKWSEKTVNCGHTKFSSLLLHFILLFFVVFGSSNLAFSQTGQDKYKFSGIVFAKSDGLPIPGVSVLIKGTSTGAISDLDGKFSLDVKSDDILILSMVGFQTTELRVDGKTSAEINLEILYNSLDDVVVIGYGNQKKGDVTGSISSIKGDEILKTQPVTIDQALQGKIAGMVVQQISGQPGGGVSLQVRGMTSFGGGSPLYVLDGIQLNIGSAGNGTNPIAGINPSEIESVNVLKDASATAIYGARGTDGVIIITTKRGKKSAPKITYEAYTGFQQLTKKLSVMDLREYATFTNERNTGIGWGWDTRPEFANPQYLGKGTDWQDELFRNAPMSNHSLSVTGGDERTQYFLSGSIYNQEGIALGSEFKRLSFRLNLDNKTTNWLKIGTNIQLVNIDENLNSSGNSNLGGVIKDALSQTPDIPVVNSDGSWGGRYNPNGWINNTVNPYAIAQINKADANRKQLYSSFYAEIELAKGLVLRNEASANFSLSSEDRFNPNYVMGLVENLNNSGSYNTSQSINTSITNYFNYTHVFANIYNLNLMLGHEAALDKSESVSGYRSHYPSNNVQVLNSGDPTTATNGGNKGHGAREAYFSRLNFGLNDKYLLTGTVRYDGNAIFSVKNQWVWSYSGAFAWKLNNEKFLSGISAINELKLRVGYGLTNKAAGRSYAYASTFSTVATGITGIAQYQTNIGNPDLKWEQTKNGTIGLDGSFLDWRINFSVDFYNKATDRLAMQASLPMYSGIAIGWSPGTFESPYINVGSMNNKGFDFRISTTNIKKKDFVWKTDLTVSRNINEVLKLNTDGAPIIGSKSRTIEGHSLGEFYGYVVEGVYANKVDFLGDPEKGIKPAARPVNSDGVMYSYGSALGSIWYGDIKFKDINGDGVITEKDQTYLGSPIPKFQLGLNNSVSYKNFDFNIFFSANYGNKVFNQMRVDGENPRMSVGNLSSLMDYAKLALIDPAGSATDVNNVYVLNPETKIQGIRNDNTNENNRTSDRYIEDGSFIKCKTISLGYTFPASWLQRVHISYLRAYVNVTNVFTITKYSGMDPEIGSWDPREAGVDYGYYPQSRVFTFGVNVSLNK